MPLISRVTELKPVDLLKIYAGVNGMDLVSRGTQPHVLLSLLNTSYAFVKQLLVH